MTCKIEGCENETVARQLCRKHYTRWQRHGSTDDRPRTRTVCSMDGCSEFIVGQTFCRKHYMRKSRQGSPKKRLRRRDPGPPETRWMQKVSVESPGCWLWTAGKDGNGYGAYEHVRAHQYVWTLLVGPVPDGMELDHLCRRPACCNPDHLEPVTHATNSDRGSRGKAKPRNRDQTHCKYGHEYTPENTYQKPSGGRSCKECTRIRVRKYMRRKRAAAKAANG